MTARALSLALTLVALAPTAAPAPQPRTRARRATQYGKVCPDPTAACPAGGMTFQPYDLPFRLPKNAVIYESEEFYAVVLKSVRVGSEDDCEKFVPEDERLAAQKLFPRRKVFASRCAEPGGLYYTNLAPLQRVVAVYAGATRAEAVRALAEVRATGKFPGANLRRMRAGVNGT
jgi:hypothetical protein